MLFGIYSAPDVFQCHMHKFTEGLLGVPVIADDFVTVGCGNSVDEAVIEHDRNIDTFPKRCAAR